MGLRANTPRCNSRKMSAGDVWDCGPKKASQSPHAPGWPRGAQSKGPYDKGAGRLEGGLRARKGKTHQEFTWKETKWALRHLTGFHLGQKTALRRPGLIPP